MERLLPFYIIGEGAGLVLGWVLSTVGNALTLGAYAAAVTFAVKAVW